jgi:type II secretory pathway component PulF
MATYVWKGRTLGGESQTGELEATRQEEAVEVLRKRKIMVTSLRPKGGSFQFPKLGGGSGVGTKHHAI